MQYLSLYRTMKTTKPSELPLPKELSDPSLDRVSLHCRVGCELSLCSG